MYKSNNDAFDYQVLHLTEQFYNAYPNPPYKEIMRKDVRPYNCLLLQSHYEYFICIPYRSHINHKYAFKFKHTVRSKTKKSGLDYSKMVIIKNMDYISAANAIVDQDEYNETRDNIEYIKNDSQEYIDHYIEYVSGNSSQYSPQEFKRIYGFSTLKYFHRELGIG